MKTLFIVYFLSVSLLANELKWVDEQIQAIQLPRESISSAKINTIKNPFIFLNKTQKKLSKKQEASKKTTASTKPNQSLASINKISKRTTSFELIAVINTSALINGEWYKKNAKVGKYTLSQVNRNSVLLTYKKKKILLSTKSKIQKLKFKVN